MQGSAIPTIGVWQARDYFQPVSGTVLNTTYSKGTVCCQCQQNDLYSPSYPARSDHIVPFVPQAMTFRGLHWTAKEQRAIPTIGVRQDYRAANDQARV